jgi:DamX protein
VENSQKPDPRRTIGGIIAALDKRIGALEQNAPAAQPGAPAGAGASGAAAPGPADAAQGAQARPGADRLEALGAELGDKLRDIETSLVNRIADVDDDRRRTAATLQRALEAHQEEVDESLRRRGRWTGLLFLLVILLVPLAFWLGLRSASTQDEINAAALAELRDEVARLSAAGEESPLEDRLNGLAQSVSGIAAAVERLERAGAPPELTELREQVARLSAAGGDAALEGRLSELTEIVSGISEAVEQIGVGRGESIETLLERERSERQAVDTGLAQRLGQLEDLQEDLNGTIAQQIAALRSALGGVAAASADARAPEPTDSEQAHARSEPVVEEQAPVSAQPLAATPSPDEASAAASATRMQDSEKGSTSPADEPEAAGANEGDDAPAPQVGLSKRAGTTEASSAEGEAGGLVAGSGRSAQPEAGGDGVVIVGQRPFALQLIGFFRFEELQRFAERDDLPAEVYYRQETLRGRPWYVLIHSLHEGSSAAAEERARLSPDLAALDIWIRPLEEGDRLQVLETGGGGSGSSD